MEGFGYVWDYIVKEVQGKWQEQEVEKENFKREVGIPEFSLLLETDTDQNDYLTSSVFSEYETNSSGHGKRLFHFLLHLLEKNKDNSNAIIRWENRSEGLFRICSLINLAVLWGREKNNHSMDHNKLRRALRYYIDKGKLLKVDRHIYKFTTDFKESKYMKFSDDHQSACEQPCKYTEPINSTENSPLSFSEDNTRNGDMLNTPTVFTSDESFGFDIHHNHHNIFEPTVSEIPESWYSNKTNCSSYKELANVKSTDKNLFSSNIDIPNMDNFNIPSVSDNYSISSSNDSPMSDSSDFSPKIKRSNSVMSQPEFLPNKRYCPEIPYNADFSDIDCLELYIVPDTSLSSYKDLYPDTNDFPPVCFECGDENESNFEALVRKLHKDLQFLNNA